MIDRYRCTTLHILCTMVADQMMISLASHFNLFFVWWTMMTKDSSGICRRIDETSVFGTSMQVGDCHALLLILSSSILLIWGWRRHCEFQRLALIDQQLKRDFFSRAAFAIFPFHVNVLICLALSLVMHGFYFGFLWKWTGSKSIGANPESTYYTVLFASVSNGITALLFSGGIGRRAMYWACAVGLFCGLLVALLVYFKDERLHLVWRFMVCVFYGCALFFPNEGRFSRRPGAIVWTQFMFW